MPSHEDVVREQFSHQAVTFGRGGFADSSLEWILGQLAPAAEDQVLDVAAGAAHLGRALAPHVAHVCALDLTAEMLEQGRGLATEDGLTNIAFLVGNATALPFLGDQFDLVVSRIALHHMPDPAAVVGEMVRVARPSGRVGVIDILAHEDPEAAEIANRLERLRDPSHIRTLTPAEIQGLLAQAGATVQSTDTREQSLDLEDWMQRTGTPDRARTEIRARIADELEGGPATGLRPAREAGGAVTLTHIWATVTASAGA